MLQGLGRRIWRSSHLCSGACPRRSKRGYWTSWIQTTAVGLFISLMVILATRSILTPEQFDLWGWRVPFWISIVMVGVSYLIEKTWMNLLYLQSKSEGNTSTNPLKESLEIVTIKFVLLALFELPWDKGSLVHGTVLCDEFYENVMSIDSSQVDTLGIALVMGTPFFIVFGWLSDKIGRKYIMMGGLLLAILLYRPIYKQM
jgi:MFS family permease